MTQPIQTDDYHALIVKIRRKRKAVVVLTIIALAVVAALCLPAEIVVLDNVVLDHKGLHPLLTVLFIILVLVAELIAIAIVMLPLTTSITEECDPRKYFALNVALGKQRYSNLTLAISYLYMGDFKMARTYAEGMIASNKPKFVLLGCFNKARCDFLLGDRDALKLTSDQYRNRLASMHNLRSKEKDLYGKIEKNILLSVAIAENDAEKISAYRDAEVWSKSKAVQGYVDYLKGVAAFYLNDRNEAIYRFMSVKEICGKTVFAQLAEEYLSKLNENGNA